MPLYRRYRLTPTVSSLDQLELWRAWQASSRAIAQPIHLKVDTGMSRLGVGLRRGAAALRAAFAAAPACGSRGCSPTSPRPTTSRARATRSRASASTAVLELLTADGARARVVVHLANSAAALHHPESRYGLVRLGLALYGLDPAAPRAGRCGR